MANHRPSLRGVPKGRRSNLRAPRLLRLRLEHCLAMTHGFLLVEALIAIVILSIVTATFLTGMAQALKVQDRGNETTEAILEFEKFLYEFETGKYQDLVRYGGREVKGIYQLAVQSEERIDLGEKLPSFYHLRAKLSWKEDREFLREDLFLGAISS